MFGRDLAKTSDSGSEEFIRQLAENPDGTIAIPSFFCTNPSLEGIGIN